MKYPLILTRTFFATIAIFITVLVTNGTDDCTPWSLGVGRVFCYFAAINTSRMVLPS